MTRFMLALVDDQGMLLNKPLIPVRACDQCGVLVVEGVQWWQHAHLDDIRETSSEEL